MGLYVSAGKAAVLAAFGSESKARLFFSRRLARGGWGGLAGIRRLAFVGVELLLDSGLGFPLSAQRISCRKLHLAEFTDSEHGNVLGAADDPQVSLGHGNSL